MRRLTLLAALVGGCSTQCGGEPAAAPPPKTADAPTPKALETTLNPVEALEVKGWPSARLKVGDQRLFAAVRPRKAEPPEVVLAVIGPEKIERRWRGAEAVAGDVEWPPADEWSVDAEALEGDSPLVRVAFEGASGDDVRTTTEILVLLDPEDLSRLWAGVGERVVEEMGRCRSGHEATLHPAENGWTLKREGFADWTELGPGNSQTPDFVHMRARCKAPEDEEIPISRPGPINRPGP